MSQRSIGLSEWSIESTRILAACSLFVICWFTLCDFNDSIKKLLPQQKSSNSFCKTFFWITIGINLSTYQPSSLSLSPLEFGKKWVKYPYCQTIVNDVIIAFIWMAFIYCFRILNKFCIQINKFFIFIQVHFSSWSYVRSNQIYDIWFLCLHFFLHYRLKKYAFCIAFFVNFWFWPNWLIQIALQNIALFWWYIVSLVIIRIHNRNDVSTNIFLITFKWSKCEITAYGLPLLHTYILYWCFHKANKTPSVF